MGRIGLDDLEHYGGTGGGSFFSLKNDKDVARVRIMLDGADDVQDYIYACHEVQIGDRKRFVNCLRTYNEPVDNCPFCAAQRKVTPKIYLPLYNVDEDQVQIWERGKSFGSKLSSIISRYGSKTPLVNHVFEIERNGKPNNKKTTYEFYEDDKDDTFLEDLPEVPEILGGIVLDKTADDMEYYLEEGEFPPDDDEEIMPRPRGNRGQKREDPEDEEEQDEDEEREVESRRRNTSSSNRGGRRTPASGGTRRKKF